MSKSLWGEIGRVVPSVRNPTMLLREQASALEQDTQGLLNGEVDEGYPNPKDYFHLEAEKRPIKMDVLSIVAPSLNFYKVHVLGVRYPIGFYPAEIDSRLQSKTFVAHTEEEFRSTLEAILKSEEVTGIVKKLVAHIVASSTK